MSWPERALAAYHQGDYQTALPLLRQMLEDEPTNLERMYQLACCLVQLKSYLQAMEYFRRLYEYRPKNPLVLRGLGLCLMQLKAYEKALPYLKQAALMEPDSQLLRLQWAQCAYRAKDFEAAIEIYEALLDETPYHPEANFCLGLAYLRAGNYFKASRALSAADHLGVEHPHLGLYRALAYQYDNRLMEALAVMRDWAGRYPTTENRHQLASLLFTHGDLLEAASVLNDIQTVEPNNIKALQQLALVYDQLGQFEVAESHYQALLAVDTSVAEHYMNVGRFYYRHQVYHKAIECFIRAIELESTKAPYYAALGDACYQREAYEMALGAYQEAVRHNPAQASYHFALGNTRFMLGDFESAKAAYLAASKLDPEQSLYRDWLSKAQARLSL